jgi:hypothetical protein
MKKTLALLFLCVMIGGALWATPCVSRDYDTQSGVAQGAGGSSPAGQAIGRDGADAATGYAGNARAGAEAGNVVGQTDTAVRLAQAQPPQGYGPPPQEPQGYGPPPQEPQGYGPPPPTSQGYGPPPGGEVPPPYTFAAPPDVVPIAGTSAYFVPGIGVDILFYGGYWYRSFGGRWFAAPSYNGPWMFVPGPRVPRVFFSLPAGWRRVPRGYHPIPHAELHRNWQRWDREGHR